MEIIVAIVVVIIFITIGIIICAIMVMKSSRGTLGTIAPGTTTPGTTTPVSTAPVSTAPGSTAQGTTVPNTTTPNTTVQNTTVATTVPSTPSYLIKHGSDGSCVTSTNNGIALNTCNSSMFDQKAFDQKWKFNANGTITNSSGDCLNMPVDTRQLTADKCNGDIAQIWDVADFNGQPRLKYRADPTKCMSEGVGILGTRTVETWDCGNYPTQLFKRELIA